MDTEAIKAKMKLAERDKAEVFDVMYEHFDALIAEVERLRAALTLLVNDIKADPMAAAYFDLRHIDMAKAALAEKEK